MEHQPTKLLRNQLPPVHSSPWLGPSRGGKEGKVFPGPAAFGGPPSLENTENGVPNCLVLSDLKCIHNIHFRPGLRPDPLGKLTTLPRPLVDGEVTPMGPPHISFLSTPSASRFWSVHTERGCDRARDNGFPNPAVALDGPVHDFALSCVFNLSRHISEFLAFFGAKIGHLFEKNQDQLWNRYKMLRYAWAWNDAGQTRQMEWKRWNLAAGC